MVVTDRFHCISVANCAIGLLTNVLQPLLKLGYVRGNTPRRFKWAWLLIHALIMLDQQFYVNKMRHRGEPRTVCANILSKINIYHCQKYILVCKPKPKLSKENQFIFYDTVEMLRRCWFPTFLFAFLYTITTFVKQMQLNIIMLSYGHTVFINVFVFPCKIYWLQHLLLATRLCLDRNCITKIDAGFRQWHANDIIKRQKSTPVGSACLFNMQLCNCYL